jgi:hypothetical protein
MDPRRSGTPRATRPIELPTSAWLVVPWPVLVSAGLMVLGLLAVSGAYGFRPDETYYVVAGKPPRSGTSTRAR